MLLRAPFCISWRGSFRLISLLSQSFKYLQVYSFIMMNWLSRRREIDLKSGDMNWKMISSDVQRTLAVALAVCFFLL